VSICTDLAYKLSRILHEYAGNCHHAPNNRQIAMYAGHSLWLLWNRTKCWLRTPDKLESTFICKEWVLFCQKLLEQKMREEPFNDDLKKMMFCFAEVNCEK
jgi:hypothetical protein